jgi:dolichyl-phosphate beta-glucosyltransferase
LTPGYRIGYGVRRWPERIPAADPEKGMDVRHPERRRGGPVTSLVFPTYNPGRAIERTCAELRYFLRRAPGRWEVLFVCDGCTDDTPERLARLLPANDADCRILRYAPNRGKGYAVRTGLAAARGDWRLFADVDLAYGFDEILRVARALQGGADVAIASRTHPESCVQVPAVLSGYVYRRHLQSRAFGLLTRWLLSLSVQDTQAGLKGLSAEAARRLLPELGCDGFGFDCELLAACAAHGLAVVEVPVCVRYDSRTSTTDWRSVARMVAEIWRVRRARREQEEMRWTASAGSSSPPTTLVSARPPQPASCTSPSAGW